LSYIVPERIQVCRARLSPRVALAKICGVPYFPSQQCPSPSPKPFSGRSGVPFSGNHNHNHNPQLILRASYSQNDDALQCPVKSAIPELATVSSLEQERFQRTLENRRGMHQLEFCWQAVPCTGGGNRKRSLAEFQTSPGNDV